ncbi:MAG: Do family serine endopeptidase [Alphaproteobacteria bacterium]|nr:Do family serine endopeptidase [Alphaproteobacteria bacterium]
MKKILFLVGLCLLGSIPVQAQTPAVPQSRAQINLTFAPLVKQAAPAVVNIYTQKKVQQRLAPLFSDPFFQQFFGSSLPRGFTRERLENSLGSGVIIRSDGLIVTSNHVVQGADQIRVVLHDRREFDATILTADERADLAVLRIDVPGTAFPYLEIKDSDEAEIGDLVLAIGNPFGVGQTVTSGIISAVAHGAIGSSDLDYFIQTDAAINPGNSGGALLTMDGKLIGINAAIYSRSGGNMGIGFAVPSNMVRVVMNAVAQGKKTIVRPWLGIEAQEVTQAIAASMNMGQPIGILVNGIHSASPAGKAGLQVGDVITNVNGRVIENSEAFRYRIATLTVGSSANLGILRRGQKLSFAVNLIPPPENPPRDETTIKGNNPFGGATVQNLSPAVIEETGFRGPEQGVIITQVKGGSSASNVGFRPGDVLLGVNTTKLSSVRDVVGASKQPGPWRITMQRGNNTVTIMVGG